jgi:two-component system chemotaxis family response regulator WspR
MALTFDLVEGEIQMTEVLPENTRLYADRWKSLVKEKTELERELLALKSQNRRLQRLVALDPLSGLANRLALEHVFAPRWEEHSRGGLIVLDLDRFKSVNDTHGHAAGDAVIELFGRIVAQNIREGDCAARYGGEEFVVLAMEALLDESHAIAERIRRATERTIFPGGLRMTVSSGVSAGAPPDWERDFKAADAALYRAKAEGRNRVIRAGGTTSRDLAWPSGQVSNMMAV